MTSLRKLIETYNIEFEDVPIGLEVESFREISNDRVIVKGIFHHVWFGEPNYKEPVELIFHARKRPPKIEYTHRHLTEEEQRAFDIRVAREDYYSRIRWGSLGRFLGPGIEFGG